MGEVGFEIGGFGMSSSGGILTGGVEGGIFLEHLPARNSLLDAACAEH